MTILPVQIPVPERIETRRHQRNLDNFLNYRFDENKKLILIEEKVHEFAVDFLKEIDADDINWKNYPSLWWNNNLSLNRISHYISSQAAAWGESLQNDKKKLILLEKQCALFEKVINKYNQKNKDKTIPFNNLFKKELRISLSYPAVIGEKLQHTISKSIVYDRLTSVEQLVSDVNAALSQSVIVKVPSQSSINSPEIHSISLFVTPSKLFRNVFQAPEDAVNVKILFDPREDQLWEKVQNIHLTYENPDQNVLTKEIYTAGEQKSIPEAYEEGMVAGRIAGFNEAVEKFKAAFSGK